MRMTSKGSQRDKGTKTHFSDTGYVSSRGVVQDGSPCIRIMAFGDRRYTLILTPEEVINCLLALPTGSIADAVSAAGMEGDLSKRLPEVLKQLVAGAIATVTAERSAQ